MDRSAQNSSFRCLHRYQLSAARLRTMVKLSGYFYKDAQLSLPTRWHPLLQFLASNLSDKAVFHSV